MPLPIGQRRRTTGDQGEQLAADYLASLGYQILKRNYRNRYGEIDLVAMEGECLVFIEVKTRIGNRFGAGFEAVDLRKQQQLERVAMAYLTQHGDPALAMRFDVVSIRMEDRGPAIQLIRNAFDTH
jgi:putative endonuclease